MSDGLSRSAALYYSEVAKTETISDPQEERRLIQRWQKQKDIRARDIIIKSHLRFVVSVARKRSRDPERLPDLVSAGNIGLIKALDKFDLNRKPPTRFLTYAAWWVTKEVADEDYATSSLVHVPTHRQKAQRKQAKAFQKAVQEHGPEARKVLSMDPGTPEGVTVAFETTAPNVEPTVALPADHSVDFTNASSNTFLRRAISRLPTREQTVLNLYYGVKDDPRNFVQIAEIMDMSPERVRQIKIAGTKQLKEMLESQAILTYTDAY